jgi:hypothetical protein
VQLSRLLLEKVITSEEEGGQWLAGGEHRDGVTEFGVQSAQHIDHHGGVRHRVPNVMKKIWQMLEMIEIIMNE